MTTAKMESTTLWMCEIDVGGGSGAYGLHSSRNAAIDAGQSDAGHWPDCEIAIASAQLCDENDPDLYMYDNERESYFELAGPVEVVKKHGRTW